MSAITRAQVVVLASLTLIVAGGTGGCQGKDPSAATASWLDAKPNSDWRRVEGLPAEKVAAWTRKQEAAWQQWAADGKQIPGITSHLISLFSNERLTERKRRIMFGFWAVGDAESIPFLSAVMLSTEEDASVSASAAWALRYIGDQDAVPALARAVGDPRWQVRYAACYGLGHFSGKEVIEALEIASEDAEAGVRNAARFWLGRVREGDAEGPAQNSDH